MVSMAPPCLCLIVEFIKPPSPPLPVAALSLPPESVEHLDGARSRLGVHRHSDAAVAGSHHTPAVQHHGRPELLARRALHLIGDRLQAFAFVSNGQPLEPLAAAKAGVDVELGHLLSLNLKVAAGDLLADLIQQFSGAEVVHDLLDVEVR